jgi:hypothetical protein
MVNEDKLQKMQRILANAKATSAFIEEPEIPPCPVCGRLIYCGAKKFCDIKGCPKK